MHSSRRVTANTLAICCVNWLRYRRGRARFRPLAPYLGQRSSRFRGPNLDEMSPQSKNEYWRALCYFSSGGRPSSRQPKAPEGRLLVTNDKAAPSDGRFPRPTPPTRPKQPGVSAPRGRLAGQAFLGRVACFGRPQRHVAGAPGARIAVGSERDAPSRRDAALPSAGNHTRRGAVPAVQYKTSPLANMSMSTICTAGS